MKLVKELLGLGKNYLNNIKIISNIYKVRNHVMTIKIIITILLNLGRSNVTLPPKVDPGCD